jgi:hypothetical protein
MTSVVRTVLPHYVDGTPTKRPVTKRPVKKLLFTKLSYRMPRLQNLQVTKRPFTKRPDYKTWTFCVLDVLYSGCSVTGHFVAGRFVSRTFCILDVL